MFIQEELTPKELAAEIETLLSDKEQREKMAQAAEKLAKPDAADIIVEEIIALAGK
jgi:UDP-N-acetylglucosamine:LPS N-acetylglucosamine transferase